MFWVNRKLYFSNKYNKANTDIVLNENGNLILKNEEIAKTFNYYFSAIVDSPSLNHGKTKLLLYQALLIKLTTSFC